MSKVAPWVKSRSVTREESFISCASSNDSSVMLSSMPASVRSRLTPSGSPLTPLMKGSVLFSSESLSCPLGIREPFLTSNMRFSWPCSPKYLFSPSSPRMVCLSPTMPPKAMGNRSQFFSDIVMESIMATEAAHALVAPSIPNRCGLTWTNFVELESRSGLW